MPIYLRVQYPGAIFCMTIVLGQLYCGAKSVGQLSGGQLFRGSNCLWGNHPVTIYGTALKIRTSKVLPQYLKG